MYKINTLTENGMQFIELQNASKTTSAKICLDQGARLQELKFNDVYLIKEQENFDYKVSYASSLLFPFASRIENGKYAFKGEDYQLNCNDEGKNALHGLIFDKKFELFEPEEHKHSCFATFNYFEKNLSEGFPFTYFFSVTYTLFEDNLNISMSIHNTGDFAFPFILGWHPYFVCDDFENSYLTFNSDKKIVLNENLVAKEIVDEKTPEVFELHNKKLDDCFVLNDNTVTITTPAYKVQITQNSEKSFLQLYTPKEIPVIAIEPMTGISNSFNNKIGLQVLEPHKTHAFKCNLRIINEHNKI